MQGHVWQLRTQQLQWQERPLLMGILNVTPDSFSDGGLYSDPEAALDRALELEAQGADILDLGGESSRPGAERVSAEVELARVLPVVQKLQGRLRIPLSVDTWKSLVARVVLEEGAEIINDISAGQWDLQLWPTVAEASAGYVLMHSPGQTPELKHHPVDYLDPTAEVAQFLSQFLARAEENGIALQAMVCDPGFGFAKGLPENLNLLKNFERFQWLHRPILVGLSRKSFLKTIGGADHLEITTLLAQTWVSTKGAALWRVHDVSSALRAAKLSGLFERGSEGS